MKADEEEMDCTKEKVSELIRLPDVIVQSYSDAFQSEVFHHIMRTFGYDLSALDQSEQDDLFQRINDFVYRDDLPTGRASCRAFAQYVRNSGGESKFGLSDGSLAEW